jgi:hypothetical protein
MSDGLLVADQSGLIAIGFMAQCLVASPKRHPDTTNFPIHVAKETPDHN